MENPFDQFDQPAATNSPEGFKSQYGELADRVGKELDVDPSLVLGQWGLETGWGKSVVPGTNNLGNIKAKVGVAATDNQTGSQDKYQQFDSPEDFGDRYVNLIKSKYPNAVGSKSDASKFVSGLSGYAEDKAYGSKVTQAAKKIGLDSKTSSENPFDQFDSMGTPEPESKFTPTKGVSGSWDEGKNGASGKWEKEESPATRLKTIGSNLLAAHDMVAATPGAVLGPLSSAIGSWAAIAQGAPGKEQLKFGHEFGQKVSENLTQALSYPVHKILELTGTKVDTSESGVQQALNKAGEIVNKGAKYLVDLSGGFIPQEQAEDMVNAASFALIPRAVNLTAKGLLKTASKVPEGEAKTAQVREIETPSKPLVNDTPEASALRNIEETTGVNRAKERTKEYRQQAMANAREAFTDDAQYNKYVKTYAEGETLQKGNNYLKAEKPENISEVPKPLTSEEAGKIITTSAAKRTPEQIRQLSQFGKQGGQVDPKLLAQMGAIGLGVTAGAYLNQDEPLWGAIYGGLAGAGGRYALSKIPDVWKAGKSFVDIAKTPKEQIRITDLGDKWETDIANSARYVWQQTHNVIDSVPDKAGRTKITHWLQGDKTIPLTDVEYAAARQIRTYFDQIGKEAQSAGVLGNLRQDYVTNLWDLEGSNKATWQKMTGGMSPNSKFNLQRKISSIAEGKKLGLKPVTEDISTIMALYGNSITRTMANRQLITTLKNTPTKVAGQQLVMSADSAPKNYVRIDHNQLINQRVHPDIQKSMEFLFDQKTPSGIAAGIQFVNMAIKRAEVTFSLFHAKALVDAAIGAGMDPRKLWKLSKGTDPYLQQLRRGGAGDVIDLANQGGLKYSLSHERLVDEDIGGNFYAGMKGLQREANEIIPGAGKAIEGIKKANEAFDEFMWARLHTGMKLNVFASTFEKMKMDNIKAHEANPSISLKTDKEIAGIVANYTNDIFGGLNWRRIAEGTKNRFAREMALNLMKPSARQNWQLVTFAPDWTLSTTRAFLKAFGKGSGLKGILRPENVTDLHRQYILRSAAYYFTVGNALNYALSGHSILQNKDPTVIDMGDGRTLQFSKHAMEPIHWFTKPGQQALNKLGIFPSETLAQATGKEYLSTKGAPDMKNRATHVLKKLVPIPFQQTDPARMGASLLGFPILGMTKEEAAKAKAEAKRERAKEHRKRKEKFFD